MLEVQRWLKENNKDFALLEETYGIKANFHPEYPLAILNYCQLNSPKMEKIVRECRGLVIDTNTLELVAACMERFFNMGEAEEITKNFVWDNQVVSRVKEDGSLISIFWNPYANNWQVKTRGSWADQPIGENMPRWDELVVELINNKLEGKDWSDVFWRSDTYIFELCTMYNQVVRLYQEPQIFLITAFTEGREFSDENLIEYAEAAGFDIPEKINVKDALAVRNYINNLEETDGTAEGLVLRDRNSLRMKVKSQVYLAFSRLGNNGNICSTKAIIPLILANEQDEAIAIFPAISPHVEELQKIIQQLKLELLETWALAEKIEIQKDFALFVQPRTKLSSILFKVRSKGGTAKDVEDIFRNSENLILKVIE